MLAGKWCIALGVLKKKKIQNPQTVFDSFRSGYQFYI